MRVLFDTNVILDVLLAREPFVEHSADAVATVEKGDVEGYLCATTVTTIDYLASKSLGKDRARAAIQSLLSVFEIAGVDKRVLLVALGSTFTDFEDAVQHYSGKLALADCIVTRNIADFKEADCPVYGPGEFLGVLQST